MNSLTAPSSSLFTLLEGLQGGDRTIENPSYHPVTDSIDGTQPPQSNAYRSPFTSDVPLNRFIHEVVTADESVLDQLGPDELSGAIDRLLTGVSKAELRAQKKTWSRSQQAIQEMLHNTGMKDSSADVAEKSLKAQVDAMEPLLSSREVTSLLLLAQDPVEKSTSAENAKIAKVSKRVFSQVSDVVTSDPLLSTSLLTAASMGLADDPNTSYMFAGVIVLGMINGAVAIHRGRGLVILAKALERKGQEAAAQGNAILAKTCEERSKRVLRQGTEMVLASSGGFARSVLLCAAVSINISITALESMKQPVVAGLGASLNVIGTTTGALAVLLGAYSVVRESRSLWGVTRSKREILTFIDRDLKRYAELPGTEEEVQLAMNLLELKLHNINSTAIGNGIGIAGGTVGIAVGISGIAVASGVVTAGVSTVSILVVAAAIIGARYGVAKYRKYDWKKWQENLHTVGEESCTQSEIFAALYYQIKRELASAELRHKRPEGDPVDYDLHIEWEFEATARKLIGEDDYVPVEYPPFLFTHLCQLVLGIPGELFVQLVESTQEELPDSDGRMDATRQAPESLPEPRSIQPHATLSLRERARHLILYSDESDPVVKQRHLDFLVRGEVGRAYLHEGVGAYRAAYRQRKRLIAILARVVKKTT